MPSHVDTAEICRFIIFVMAVIVQVFKVVSLHANDVQDTMQVLRWLSFDGNKRAFFLAGKQDKSSAHGSRCCRKAS